VRVYSLLHEARSVLVDFGAADVDVATDRMKVVRAQYGGPWELPAWVLCVCRRPYWSGRMASRLGCGRDAGWSGGGAGQVVRGTFVIGGAFVRQADYIAGDE